MESRLKSAEINKLDDKLELVKTVQVMDRLHAEKIFATPEMSKEFLDSLSFDDFVKWTNFISAIETNTPRKLRGIGSDSIIESYSNVSKTTRCAYMPPYEKYRVPLFEKAFEKSQSIKDPKIAGLTLGFAVNRVHPYGDGNGRTGRLIYSLLSKGYSGSLEDTKYYSDVLRNLSGRKLVNPNSLAAGLDQEILKEMRGQVVNDGGYSEFIPLTHVSSPYRYSDGRWVEPGDEIAKYLPLSSDISEQDRQRLYYVLQDETFALIPILKTFSPDRIIPLAAKRLPEYDDGTTYIDGKKFVSSLNSDDINNLFEQAIALKNEFVEQIINFSDRPDAEKYINMFN